jgi:hypothetical protein
VGDDAGCAIVSRCKVTDRALLVAQCPNDGAGRGQIVGRRRVRAALTLSLVNNISRPISCLCSGRNQCSSDWLSIDAGSNTAGNVPSAKTEFM